MIARYDYYITIAENLDYRRDPSAPGVGVCSLVQIL